MKLSGARVEAFLAAPGAEIAVALVYGPDQGLVSARARRLAQQVAGRLDDAFQVTTLTPGDLAGDSARLADEAAALGLFGGRRAVRVRDAADAVAGAVGGLLDGPAATPPLPSLVILEAGDLAPRSALRRLCEAAPAAVTIPCYQADAAGVVEAARRHLEEAGIRADREALAALAEKLVGDHGVMVSELDKLISYIGDDRRLTLEHVRDGLGDAAQSSLDVLSLAVTGGAVAEVDRMVGRLLAEGVPAIRLIRGVQRHVDRLSKAAVLADRGQSEAQILSSLRIFFKQQPAYRRQFRAWPRRTCQAASTRLFELELACKSTGVPAETVVRDGLLAMAAATARRSARPS